MDIAQLQKLFESTAGKPVPEVDPADIKAVLEIGLDMERRHPGGEYAIGRGAYQNACKPGALTKEVLFRADKINTFRLFAPSVMDPLLQQKLEAVCVTAAHIPMKWTATDLIRDEWAFDPDEFIRRVREA
jgi:hypothetical protein